MKYSTQLNLLRSNFLKLVVLLCSLIHFQCISIKDNLQDPEGKGTSETLYNSLEQTYFSSKEVLQKLGYKIIEETKNYTIIGEKTYGSTVDGYNVGIRFQHNFDGTQIRVICTSHDFIQNRDYYTTSEEKNIIEEIRKDLQLKPFDLLADTKYPTIKILSPQNFRGMKPLKESSLEIIGLASDESGVSLVSVNGKAAQLSEPSYSEVQQYNVSGKVVKFSGEVSLSMRENTITIIATDTKNNTAEETFTVVREEEKISPPITTNDSQFIKGKYYALIIAVQDYKSIMGLEYPLQDAENVKNVLTTNYTFENNAIHFLKNPNRKDIFSALQQLKKKLSAEDNLLIYYAGHGFWDVDNSQGYWLPASASWDDRAEWISNSDIRDNIKSIKTKHTLLISDACFSGGIFKSREAKEKPDISIQKMYELPSRKAITSGTFKTAVPDKSVFADYLLKRLKENSAKYLDAENLYINFKQAVINNGPTVPQFGVIYDAGDEGGDFIFVRK